MDSHSSSSLDISYICAINNPMTDQNYNTFPRIRTIHGINYLCNSDLSTCIPLLYDYVASPCEEVIVVAKGGFQDDCKEYGG